MSDWTAAWNASPTDSDLVGNGDEAIADTRDTLGDRLVKEHFLDMSEVSPQPQQGRHRPGSAVSYAQAAAPTLKPDGSAVLDAIDHGRLWLDIDTNIMYFWKWGTSSGAWTECAPAHGLVLLTSGTSWTATYTGPVKVTCVGGGGGGGSCKNADASDFALGGSGGGGGAGSRIYNVVAGSSYAIAIGAAGAAGTYSPRAHGGVGGNTTFTDGVTLLTATGGKGGVSYNASGTASAGPGGGGTATNATVTYPGTAGLPGFYESSDSIESHVGSLGGSSLMGSGGSRSAGPYSDNDPQGYGAGGAGAYGTYAGTPNSQAGTAGCILIEW